MQLIILTGMSGSGKSTAMKVLEDIGFYCIDNLPPLLIPKFVDICEQTGGSLSIESKTKEMDPEHHGTKVTATFYTDHIDFTPLGDVVSSITTLIQGHPDTDFLFRHTKAGSEVELDTRQIREILEDVPLSSFEVIQWIDSFLREQYSESAIDV